MALLGRAHWLLSNRDVKETFLTILFLFLLHFVPCVLVTEKERSGGKKERREKREGDGRVKEEGREGGREGREGRERGREEGREGEREEGKTEGNFVPIYIHR